MTPISKAENLEPPGKPSIGARLKRITLWIAAGCVWVLLGVAGLVAWYAYQLPPIDDLMSASRRPGITVVTADGTMLANSGDFYGTAYAVTDLPLELPQAVIAIEDHRFYQHHGVDPMGLVRAFWTNLRAGHMVQGGSTITQQVAKNVFLTPDRTLKRKIQEVLLALWLEHRFTKAEILGIYLNRAYLGAGTFGVDAAAQRYFNRRATDLDLAESAVLAGLLKAPVRYSPAHNPKLAADRARTVLGAMVTYGFVTADQAKAAADHLPTLAESAIPRPGPYFTDWVIDQVPGYLTIDRDLVVVTTLNPAIQSIVDHSLSGELAAEGPKRRASTGAAIVMSEDGAVLAMSGGPNYSLSQFNRSVQSLRQPGSSFKLFVYLAALEHGRTPDSMVLDAPITIGDWTPHNFEKGYRGELTMTEALAHSVNTVAARLILEVGHHPVVQMARRLGITAPLANDDTLALGSSGVSLIELTGAYTAVSNGGTGVWPYGITEIRDSGGTVLWRRSGSGPGHVLEEPVVTAMDQMLQAVVDHGTGKAANFAPGSDPGIAGKTGTTSDFRDAWFLGYHGGLTTGVWLGNDDDTPMDKETGGDLPAKIWRQIMTKALEAK